MTEEVAPGNSPVAADRDLCEHCGLPLGRWPFVARIDSADERLCCFGCALARQITRGRGESGQAASALVRLGLAIFFAMNAMMVTLPTYVPAVYGDGVAADGPLFHVMRVLATVFTLPVLLLLGGPILAGAVRGLRAGLPNTDALIVLGTAAAWTLSVANVAAGRPEVYFDTVAMLLVLVTLGRYLEARARAQAGESVSRSLAGQPATALRLESESDRTGAEVALEALAAGDLVRVTAGATFPADGVVVAGSGGVDQSVLTGEHRPLLIVPGDDVAGGSSSVDGVFTVRLRAAPGDSTAARIERLLAEARGRRTEWMRLADRVAAVMMPLVTIVAAGAGIWWGRIEGVDRGLLVALAVLCVACPCGLGIATPVAVWTALRTAARRGIVVRDPAALERMARVRRVYFDKTGTLTERTPVVAEVTAEPGSGWSEDDVLAAAAAVERGLLHPVARSVTAAQSRAAAAKPAAAAAAENQQVIPGRGVSAALGGTRTWVGSLDFAAAELGRALAPGAGDAGEVAVWQPGVLRGRLRLRERARPDAGAALAGLRALGVDARLLTGDTHAGAVVPALIDSRRARLGLLPEEKMAHLEEARTTVAVAMVGDGINDGPALAAADVGVAVAAATDLARVTADVVLMGDDLSHLPWLVAFARRAENVIRGNLLWVFAYNAAAVVAAAAGLLTPLVATLAMIASSLVVVARARRLRLAPAAVAAPGAPQAMAAGTAAPRLSPAAIRGTPNP